MRNLSKNEGRGDVSTSPLPSFFATFLLRDSPKMMSLSKIMAQQGLPKAFLIVNGTHIFPLNKHVISIGRLGENDLVIEDARISRHHAQFRFENNHFMLIDLQSTGGTSVNGTRVHQIALQVGDVISLAGIPLLYGEYTNEQAFEENIIRAKQASKKSSHPTVSVTDAVNIHSVDRYLEMFEIDQG